MIFVLVPFDVEKNKKNAGELSMQLSINANKTELERSRNSKCFEMFIVTTSKLQLMMRNVEKFSCFLSQELDSCMLKIAKNI